MNILKFSRNLMGKVHKDKVTRKIVYMWQNNIYSLKNACKLIDLRNCENLSSTKGPIKKIDAATILLGVLNEVKIA